MNSMTGYGKFVVTEQDRQVTIEMKSVNNRFLEINCRVPKSLSVVEDAVKRAVKKHLRRGSVDVFFNYENNSPEGKILTVDDALASAYVETAKKLSETYGLANTFTVTDLMRTSDVIKIDSEEDDEQLLKTLVEKCAEGAAAELSRMRAVEGETIRDDLSKLIGNIDSALSKAEARAPMVVEDYSARLKTRIDELLDGVAIDEARLANEVAFFADKADVNEEISRLHSHIAQFRAALDADGQQGRNLDFLSQEIGREINTMGSKSNDTELTNIVIYMKNELEKIKEQIRNVE